MITIRNATEEDAKNILDIFSYYIKNTVISFDYDIPELSAFKNKIKNTIKNYPYYVIEEDGIIKGYTYAGPFVGRSAYSHSCELTIYLDPSSKKKGFGRMLYETIEEDLKKRDYTNLYACIGYTDHPDEYLNNNSMEFHAHMGFKTVGHFRNCGYKFNRWYDMIWMEKIISEYKTF